MIFEVQKVSISKRDWLPYLASTIAVTLFVTSLAAVAFYFEKQRHLERAQIATNNIVQLLAQNTSNLFDKIDVALQSGALFHQHQLIPGPFRIDELNDYLRSLGDVVPEVDSIRILDEHGVVRYGHHIPVASRTDLSDRAYFLKARDDIASSGKLIVDGPLFARISQKWVVVFARRLNKPDGTFAGVIYANLKTTQLEKSLSSIALGANGAATIRTTGLALVHRVPDTKNAVGSNNVSAELKAAVSDKPEGGDYLAATALDGIERTNAYRKVGNYPFYVIVGLATRDYLGSSQQNLLIIIGLTLLTILLSGSASYRAYCAHKTIASDLQERNQLNKALHDSLAQRDRLNSELVAKAKEAEGASKAKSAFLSNMSHELRTPLHQIDGLAHLLGREPLSERQVDRLKNLGAAVQRMTSLVDAVLELTKIESGSLDLSEERIDLPEFVEEVVEAYRTEAAAKQLALVVCEIPVLPGLIGDKVHVRQAFNNYLANALRFTQAGRIEVRVSVMREDNLSCLIRFEVEDSGRGIKSEDIPRLFTIFEQVDNSTTRHFGGLGIGLAMTRKIAEALGGETGCRSTHGSGSTFWFSVRMKKQTITT